MDSAWVRMEDLSEEYLGHRLTVQVPSWLWGREGEGWGQLRYLSTWWVSHHFHPVYLMLKLEFLSGCLGMVLRCPSGPGDGAGTVWSVYLALPPCRSTGADGGGSPL